MNMKSCLKYPHALSLGLGVACGLLAVSASAQIDMTDVKNIAASRVAAMDILGGDYGLNGGSYNSENNAKHNVQLKSSKFGGMGDVGDPSPLGDTGIAWQPRLQGSMGYLTTRKSFTDPSTPINGDINEFDTFAIQFGGGARFWFNDHLSLAPTIMGMYGHTSDSYTANSAFAQGNYTALKNAGVIDWNVDTWTVRPAGQLAYVFTWRRTIFTLTSDGTYFHTESFTSSNPNFSINGDSEMWQNKIDVDVPLGVQIFNHELRTGGYFSRSDFFGDLNTGLNTDHLYEVHGRVVLDFLGQLWKCQWIGVGYSYLWGSNFNGISYGLDVAFQF